MAMGAVLLHPHPSYGGDQHNVVITALWEALRDAGAPAVRFDFASADVDACVAQAVAAIDSLPADVPVAMVGYSFGGIVASRVLDERVAAWVLVAAPVLDGPIGGDPRPKLVLVPAHDQFLAPAAARSAVAGWQAATVEEVASADHFLHGVTGAVAARVVDWLSSPVGP
jgi:alpha/beta superfamily hydrolase